MVGVLKFMVSVIVYYFLLHFTAFDLRLLGAPEYLCFFSFILFSSMLENSMRSIWMCWANVRFFFQSQPKERKKTALCIGAEYTVYVRAYKNIVILYDSIRIIYLLFSFVHMFVRPCILFQSIHLSIVLCFACPCWFSFQFDLYVMAFKETYSKLNTIFYTQVKRFAFLKEEIIFQINRVILTVFIQLEIWPQFTIRF